MADRHLTSPEADEIDDMMALPALDGIRRLSAIDTVRARIAMAVDLKLLRPGEKLPSVVEIAAALDVSEITVKRALTQLAEEGVLERTRGRNGGTRVAGKPRLGSLAQIAAYRSAAHDVRQLIDQRVILECGITALAADRATKKQLNELRSLASKMDTAETWADFHTTDERFHLLVAEMTKVPYAKVQYGRVLHELYRFFLPYPIEYLRESNSEHHELVAALSERDQIAAVGVACRHVEALHRTMFVGLS